MDAKQAIDFLRDNPIFWSRLGFCYDPPIFDEFGKPLVIEQDFDFFRKTHESFSDIGIKVHTCILHTGWVGVDQYDYSVCDRVLHEIFQSGKTDYFVPRIKLNVPVDWCYQNPTEVCVYYEGPRKEKEIQALVGTQKQDYLGYESEVGYYNAGRWNDSRPNVGGLISLQSFSSKKWKQDAGEALKRLVRHLEESPYGERILAYHITFGACGESMPWGRQSGKFGDYGISNQKHFLEWGLKKYGSEKALRDAWGDFQGDVVPMPQQREWIPRDADHAYREEHLHARSIDYDRFTADQNVEAFSYFGKIVKDNSGQKAVGCFYGYLLHMRRSAYAGHLGWEKALQSPYIDFFAAPKSYHRCQPGEAGGEMAPAVSINRKKLWVDECDNRTHLSKGDSHGMAKNLEETQTVHLRELCKNISHDSGLWYMDLGGGWYDDEQIMAHLSNLLKASVKLRKRPHQSVAEVFWAVDEEGILHGLPDRIKTNEESMRNLQLAGAPVDVVFAKDLLELDISRAKLVILQDPITLTAEFLQTLRKRLPKGCSLCWFGKSGAENGFDLINSPKEPIPSYTIKEENRIKPLAYDEEGGIAVARNDKGDFMVASFPLQTETARKILDASGVRCLAPSDCAVYADNRILSFFPREDVNFVLELEKECDLTDLQTGMVYPKTKKIELNIQAKSGRAFAIEKI